MTKKGELLWTKMIGGILLVSLLTAAAFAVFSSWTNGQDAVSVLGQTDFVTGTPGDGNARFAAPAGVIVDPVTGKVFVSDLGNNRILRFTGALAQSTGGAAEAVIGAPDFVTTDCVTSQTRLCLPYQIAIDSSGALWVGDAGNGRVLRFDNAATVASGTATAAQVLGQTDFVTNSTGTSATKFKWPSGVSIGPGGVLWVADELSSRVLRFNNAAAKANGAPADGVLGQATMVSSGPSTSQTGMSEPFNVSADAAGRLWVPDFSNNRVLRFDNAAGKADGGAADGVLGQPNFTASVPATTQSGMSSPTGAVLDSVGRLYVSDNANHRVLIFNNAATLPPGTLASNVLGQTTFTDGASGTTQSKIKAPWSVGLDPANVNQIYVPEESNDRVTRFVAIGAPTAASVSVRGRITNMRGGGIRGARVTIAGADGRVVTVLSNSFGYYSFENVRAGDTYIAAASAKGYVFVPRAITANDSLVAVNFMGQQ